MKPQVYDISIAQGASFSLSVVVKDGEGEIKELTDYLGRGQIRNKAGGDVLAEFTVDVTEAEGKVVITLTAEETDVIPTKGAYYKEETVYYYDVELYTANDADVIRLLHGKAKTSPSITKAVVTP